MLWSMIVSMLRSQKSVLLTPGSVVLIPAITYNVGAGMKMVKPAHLKVHSRASVQVTISGANFEAVTGGTTGPVVVRGFKDFAVDGDKTVAIVLGPCTSADGRFQVSSNQYPKVTH